MTNPNNLPPHFPLDEQKFMEKEFANWWAVVSKERPISFTKNTAAHTLLRTLAEQGFIWGYEVGKRQQVPGADKETVEDVEH